MQGGVSESLVALCVLLISLEVLGGGQGMNQGGEFEDFDMGQSGQLWRQQTMTSQPVREWPWSRTDTCGSDDD
jgi:hypothetical protein